MRRLLAAPPAPPAHRHSTFAYLLALVIPAGTSRPVLAPLTALLVLKS